MMRTRLEHAAAFVHAHTPPRDPDVPVNLNALARHLGARDVRYLCRQLHGYTDFSGPAPVIFLAMSRSDGRRRFTLAHEIGHLLIRNPLLSNHVPDEYRTDEERACDAIAAELLVPLAWLDEHRTSLTSLTRLSDTAGHLRVSLAMLATRLTAAGTPTPIVVFRQAPTGAWVPIRRVGAPHAWRGQLVPTESTSSALHRLGPKPRQIPVEFHATAANLQAQAEARRHGNEITLLLRLTSRPPVVRTDPASETGLDESQAARQQAR